MFSFCLTCFRLYTRSCICKSILTSVKDQTERSLSWLHDTTKYDWWTDTQSRRRCQHQSINQAELLLGCCCGQCTVDWQCRTPSIHAPSWVLTSSVTTTIVYLVYLSGLPGPSQQPCSKPWPFMSGQVVASSSLNHKLFINNFVARRLFPLSISCCQLFNSAVCILSMTVYLYLLLYSILNTYWRYIMLLFKGT